MATFLAAQGHSTAPGYCWHCDVDVACPDHPDTSCGACEYACHCNRHPKAGAPARCTECGEHQLPVKVTFARGAERCTVCRQNLTSRREDNTPVCLRCA